MATQRDRYEEWLRQNHGVSPDDIAGTPAQYGYEDEFLRDIGNFTNRPAVAQTQTPATNTGGGGPNMVEIFLEWLRNLGSSTNGGAPRGTGTSDTERAARHFAPGFFPKQSGLEKE